jgi:hypothetical protein
MDTEIRNRNACNPVFITRESLQGHWHHASDPNERHPMLDSGHSHAITGPGHTHQITGTNPAQVLVDDVSGDGSQVRYERCHVHLGTDVRGELETLREEVARDQRSADAGEWNDADRFPLVAGQLETRELTRIVTVTVKVDTTDLDGIIREMQEAMARGLGLKPEMLFGTGSAPVVDNSRGRALMTVAPFPHTPE